MIQTRQFILVLGDGIAFFFSFCLMILIRFGSDHWSTAASTHSGPFIFLFILWFLVLFVFDFYDIRRVNPNPRNIGRLAMAFMVSAGVSIVLFYSFPYFGIAPKITLVIAISAAFVLVAGWRRLFYKIFTSFLTRSIILIGDSVAIHRFAEEIKNNPALGRIVGIWKKGQKNEMPGEEVHLLISESHEPELLLTAAEQLKCTGISLVRAYEDLFGKIPLSLMTEERAMEIISKRENIGYTFIRRFFEVIIAVTVMIVALPFFLIAAIATIIETGWPIFILQKRIGANRTPFTLYKLRSMIHNAESKSGAVWTKEKDPRITKVGRIVRKLHIDEIPQMWNVLVGDLALVGPRPERPEFVTELEKEIPYYFLRHIQKPGFTGWGQIKFRYARSVLDSKEKFEYDLYYLANRSLLLDLGIVIKTVQIIFTH